MSSLLVKQKVEALDDEEELLGSIVDKTMLQADIPYFLVQYMYRQHMGVLDSSPQLTDTGCAA